MSAIEVRNEPYNPTDGRSLRDEFAMAALGYLKSDGNLDMQPMTLATCAYEVADAMMAVRK